MRADRHDPKRLHPYTTEIECSSEPANLRAYAEAAVRILSRMRTREASSDILGVGQRQGNNQSARKLTDA